MTDLFFKSFSETEPCISETIDNTDYSFGGLYKLSNSFIATESCTSKTIDNSDHSFGDIYDLANSFLAIESMTHKKLQKLCYYAKAWYLAINDTNLVTEPFEAWVHGAVQPRLYQKYRAYGFHPIPMYTGLIEDLPEEFLSFAREIFSSYGELSGDDLEQLNHKEPPWLNAREGLKPWQNSDVEISEEDMKVYYRSLMNEK